MSSGCCSRRPVSYSRTLNEKASKSKSWHFEGKPIKRITSVNHQFLCKCAAFCFFFPLTLLFCNRCPGSFVTELFILWAVSYWAPWIGPVFCLLFRDQKKNKKRTGEREAKKKKRWNEFPKKRSRRVGEKLPTLGIDSLLLPNSADGDWMQTELSNQISDGTLKGCGNRRSGLKIRSVRNKRGPEEQKDGNDGRTRGAPSAAICLRLRSHLSDATLITERRSPRQLTGPVYRKPSRRHLI